MSKIADAFSVRARYLRSAHIERDFNDPSALNGYVVTPEIQRCLNRMAQGLSDKSGQRAWRITGDYGSGKSSFALLLAHLFAGRDGDLPSQLRRSINFSQIKSNRPQLIPVLITGSREPLGIAIVRALYRAIDGALDKRARLKCLASMEEVLNKKNSPIADIQVVELIREANAEIVAKERATGLLIILDEMGKFLEFAALHPERQDIFLLQQLAEMSAAPGRHQLFLVGLLHQGFNAYSDQLSQSSQNEWEKIAGRFQELIFDQPLDQITHLVGHALDLKQNLVPRGWETRSKAAMRSTISQGWFGAAAPITSLVDAAVSIYPLHPSVIPVLVRLFSRFGQNERSLFSFLLSNESHGLQSFALSTLSVENTFRIHHLYDYAAANFGHKLTVQSYRNHWNHIDSLIKSFPSKNDIEVHVLKTVGLLNLLNSQEMLPSEEAIITAVSDGSYESQNAVRDTLSLLHESKKVLYLRGSKGGYCLWSHTSINLESAYDDAVRAIGQQRRVTELIKDRLDARPVVARRHYIQTGNLRHFEVKYCSLVELEKVANIPLNDADGRIVIPLCETTEETKAAILFATTYKGPKTVLVGITEPLGSLAALIQEVERWGFVEKHTPELKDDRYAQEEVSRQLNSATITLEKRVQHYVGLREAAQSSGQMPIRWFCDTKQKQVETVSEFLSLLSNICDSVYTQAPIISNELINRRALSSAAAAARMRLIERMLGSRELEYLGMDPDKKPPEMSMYLSVLMETQLHRKSGSKWIIAEPKEDSHRLLPALNKIKSILQEKPDGRFTVEHIFNELRRPPFGVRDGLLPLLLLVVMLENQQEIAVYENGTFKSQLMAPDVLRLTKDPSLFELQLCKIQGVRLTVFEKLAEVLNLKATASRSEILDIVRPLCVFAAELPPYSKTTKKLSDHALKVRQVILEAREPGILLFTDLPQACGFGSFSSETETDAQHKTSKKFVIELQRCLEELKFTMPALRTRMNEYISQAFSFSQDKEKNKDYRTFLAGRAEAMLVKVTDLDLKAFCFQLFDCDRGEAEWLESLGSYVASNPPSRWKDEDEVVFKDKLIALAQKFRRVEAVNFTHGKDSQPKTAVRISITQKDGAEKEDVIYLSPNEEKEATLLEQKLRECSGANHRVMLSALSRLAWKLLEQPK
jgi:hypothetical protein